MDREGVRQRPERVSTIESFFDLVFVFDITQITVLIEHAHVALDFVRAFLVLLLIWWMYDGYTWLTNETSAHKRLRLVLIAGMAGFLVIGLSIPKVFGATGLVFGFAYLFVVLLHFAAFGATGGRKAARAIFGIVPFNLGAAALVIAAGLIRADWGWLLFLAAAVLFVMVTVLHREKGFMISASHFAERHGLVIIIALGESIIDIGAGATNRVIDLRMIVAIVLSVLLIAEIWWTYFDRDDAQAETLLLAAAPESRSRMALLGYWYAHLAMIAGIVLVAAGVREVVANGDEPLPFAALLLAGGASIYLFGEVLFRWVIGIRPLLWRAMSAIVILLAGFLGRFWSGTVALGTLTGLIFVLLAAERRFLQSEM